jgi:VIT1/CCC1 family predicted Fe2+/Mn2+ transporter
MRRNEAVSGLKEFLDSDGARTGLYFGATSGVITTLGLIAGLHAGTESLAAVLGGILVIAFADAMSDALGIHIAEEADPNTDAAHVWSATVSTFTTKFIFALSFAVPLLVLPLTTAVMASVVWGVIVIAVLSFLLARAQGSSPLATVAEHLAIAAIVVVLSHFIGRWVGEAFT